MGQNQTLEDLKQELREETKLLREEMQLMGNPTRDKVDVSVRALRNSFICLGLNGNVPGGVNEVFNALQEVKIARLSLKKKPPTAGSTYVENVEIPIIGNINW